MALVRLVGHKEHTLSPDRKVEGAREEGTDWLGKAAWNNGLSMAGPGP